MTSSAKEDRLALFGGRTRNLAAWGLFVVSLLYFLLAFWVSWSPGLSGEQKGDEGIRDALVAIALLTLGLMFAVLFVGIFLLDILVRVKKLNGKLPKVADYSKQGPEV